MDCKKWCKFKKMFTEISVKTAEKRLKGHFNLKIHT